MKLLELAEKLISFNTVSQQSSTQGISDFISNYCEGAGFKIEQYPYELPNEKLKKINVVARKGSSESKLALSGHMDTVPFDKAKWSTDPLKLTLIDNKYYGMGIADMKLFLAIAMKAGEAIKESELKHPFALYFTSDEEVGCLGARQLIRQNKIHVANSIVIGEPTNMAPLNLHKGYIFVRIILKGKSGHGSDQRTGRSVIHLALMPILQKLFMFEEMLKKITDKRFTPPYPTLNIGVITTDGEKKDDKSSKNKLAEYCKIDLEIRPIPGQSSNELYSILERLLTETIREIDGIEIMFKLERTPTPAMITSEKTEIAQAVKKISGESMDSVCFNTEGGVFNKNGSETIIWGPGSIKQAHQPREYVDARFLQQNIVDQYISLIREFCCKGGK